MESGELEYNTTNKNLFFMPMGFIALADVLRKKDFNVEVLHFDIESNNFFINFLSNGNVDCVGLCLHWFNQIYGVVEIARLIKKLDKNIFVFIGGYTASYFKTEIIDSINDIDAVISGDGEIPIIKLCMKLNKGINLDLSNIPNLTWRNESKTITNELIYVGSKEDMMRLDYTAYDLLRNYKVYVKLSKFWTNFSAFNNLNVFFLPIGRGCSYQCKFCGGSLTAQINLNKRHTEIICDIDFVMNTLKKAYSIGYRFFYLEFENDKTESWYLAFLTRLKVSGIKVSLVYGAYKLPSFKLIDKLSSSCENVLIELSPESACESIRKINKDKKLFYTNDQLEVLLDYIKKKPNVKIQIYFGYFLINDSLSSVKETLMYILYLCEKYKTYIEIEYSCYSTDPGSILFENPTKFKMEIKAKTFGEYYDIIKKTYIINKNDIPDLNFASPSQLTQDETNLINNIIVDFSTLFRKCRNVSGKINSRAGGSDGIINYIILNAKKNETYGEKRESLFIKEFIEYFDVLYNDLELSKYITDTDINEAAPCIWYR
jgi:radical SAM superfamily enzyme YgiQ (UPF0313 family)